MGSSYSGEPNLGNERSGSGSSSRKGKKSNSDKPKQPQRGLGVAQLEKIRLHSQMGCSSYLPSLHAPPYPTNPHQEDMRLQTAYSSVPVPSSSSFSYTSSSSSSSSYGVHGHQNIMMGMGELERPNIRYADHSQPSTTARSWNPGNAMLETQHFAQPGIPRHFLNQQVEDSLQKKRKKDRSTDSIGSSQNSQSDSQELDLELRLSL